jgi:adenine phosphoribosyltransferase
MGDFSDSLEATLRARIRDVPDFPKPGILFKDLTPAWGHGPTLATLADQMAARYRDRGIDAIGAIESRGFLTGAPIATQLGIGTFLLRKPGKLPWKTVSRSYALEYGEDALEMHEDAVQPGQKILLVDDLLATGGTMRAAVELVRERGAEVVECAFLVELAFLGGREKVGAPCASVVVY